MTVEVQVPGGAIRGREHDGVFSFKGVPYAAPPTGGHRFALPAPVVPWDGVRDATDYGPTAPHAPYPAPLDQLLPEPTIPGDEYLNLNVWTPDPGAAGLPVLVWIHGGAFVNGSGAVADYDGTAFARDGIVTVTINYRLGSEGFSHFDDGGPSNLGLRDQLAALAWVQASIAAFGGDPAAVTVAGESAGAMSIGALMSTPAADGLFRAAILQSGAGHHALAASTAARVTGFVADELGVPATRAAFAAVPLERLLAAQHAVGRRAQALPDAAIWGEVATNLMAFEPVIDGDLLGALPVTSIAADRGLKVPVLTGTNRDEQRLFLVPTGVMDVIDDNLLGMAAAGYHLPADAVTAYRGDGMTPGEMLADLAGDWFFRIPAIRLAESRRADPTYVYEFLWGSPAYDGRLGSCHALEIPFVFDTVGDHGSAMAGTDPPRELVSEMHGAWVRFVHTGDPGWPAYSPMQRIVRLFGGASELALDPRSRQRTVWTGVR